MNIEKTSSEVKKILNKTLKINKINIFKQNIETGQTKFHSISRKSFPEIFFKS